MKKLLFALSAISLCTLLSCSGGNSGGMSEKAKKNLATADAIAKMFESGDYSKTGDYIANDAVDHAGGMGDVVGLDSIKAEFAHMGQTMSNMKNEAVKELADDDYVFQWMKESGTMTKDEMGMKAGQSYSFNIIEVSKFNNDGKLSEHWSFMDVRDMMKMMPQQGDMGGKMDTTMHK